MFDLTQTALGLAAEGFYVFPCRPGDKPPALDGWQEASTRDPDTVRELWARYGVDCNIGIYCGKSGLAVVDIDDKYGKQGSATWTGLQLAYGDAPPTRIHRTPSGGRHYLFKQDGTINNTPVDRTCIDMRGTGGYVLGPGSIIDGKPYTLESAMPIADFPAWIPEVINARRRDKREAPDDFEPDTPWAIDQAKQEIANWISKGWVPEMGSRNNSVHSMAARLHGLGISEELAVEMIDELYIPAGLAPDEATSYIVHSAYNNPQNPPGSEARAPAASVHAGLPAVAAAIRDHLEDRLWWPSTVVNEPRVTYWDRDCLLPRMPGGGVGIWFGPTENHKTGVILAVCINLYKTTDAKILYLCGEGKAGIGPRLAAQLAYHGIDPEEMTASRRFAMQYVPMLADEAHVQRLIDQLEHDNFSPDLVFMDTMTTALLGFDEDNKSAAQLTRHGVVGKFAARLGALVVLVGHTSASTNNRLRGAQGYQDNIDVMIGQLADRRDDARGVIISTYGDDGGKQKEGRKNKVYYALDRFNGMIVPRRTDKLEYTRLTDGEKYDFSVKEIGDALLCIIGYENGITSRVVCSKIWPYTNESKETPEIYNSFIDRQAARLDRQAKRHPSFNNSLSGGGSTVALLWYMPAQYP